MASPEATEIRHTRKKAQRVQIKTSMRQMTTTVELYVVICSVVVKSLNFIGYCIQFSKLKQHGLTFILIVC